MKLFFTSIFLFSSLFLLQAQTELVGDAILEISLQNNATGVELASITENGTEILETHSYLFYLYITNVNTGVETRISATTDWNGISINNDGSTCLINFSQPVLTGLPSSLNVQFSLSVAQGKSQWDLSVSGLGNDYTLTRVNFPKFKLKTPGNDIFFVPRFSGKLIENPQASAINYDITYPRGRLGASMPFAAYYNDNYGIYLAFHDETASLKNLVIQQENNYVKYYGKHNIPDKTLAGNDWELPGVFELDIYQGNWYDATMIYKDWVVNNAGYYPQDTPERLLRQDSLGKVDIWGAAYPALNRPVSQTEADIQDFIDLFPPEIKVGIHWYKWNNQYHDDNYPDYFPARTGFENAVQNIQQQGHIVMPYINGMLYDTDLPAYPTDGLPYATKDAAGNVFTLNFGDSEHGAPINTFAVMCPTQNHWQDTLVNVADVISNQLQSKGLYIDMVGWAGATECMDTSHGHPLASGNWWFNGYQSMFLQMYQSMPDDVFITTEGAVDNLSNMVDGYLVGEWRDPDLVPAFQSIYGGKNQFFGVSYGGGTYNDASFYSKFSSYFVNNIQPGRMFLWFAHDQNAATARPYIVELAYMRHQLHDFMSFGTLLRPFEVSGIIPEITSDWGGSAGNVTVSALQKNVYRHKTGDAIAFVFSNASMTDALDFSFDINGSAYGFTGDLDVQMIAQNSYLPIETHNNTYTQNVHINALQTMAYLVREHNSSSINKIENQKIVLYPNPVNDWLYFHLDKPVESVFVYNVSGQLLHEIHKNVQRINVKDLPSGIYLLRIHTGTQEYREKFLVYK